MKHIHVTGYYIKHIYVMQLMKHIHLSTNGIFMSHRYLLSSSKTNLRHTH